VREIDVDGDIHQQIQQMMDQGLATIDIYKKTCEILFFQRGVVPTPTKLYGLVKKGSMSAPTRAVQEFFASQRERGRVDLAIPGMPESLKSGFTDALKETWRLAVQLGNTSANEQKEAHQKELYRLQADLDTLRTCNTALEETIRQLRASDAEKDLIIKNLQEAVRQENIRLTVESKRLQDANQRCSDLEQQLEKARQDFLAESSRLSKEHDSALARLKDHENRALMEIERERQIANKAVKDALTAQKSHAEELSCRNSTIRDITTQLENIKGELNCVKTKLEVSHEDLEASRRNHDEQLKVNGQLQAQLKLLQSKAMEKSSKKQIRKPHTIKQTTD
jgi:hypothetical protein